MTFLELKNLFAYYVDDLQFGYFTIPQVNIWLNNAQKEVQKRLLQRGQNYYLKCAQTTLVIYQRAYALPEDFKDLNRLEIIMSGVVPNETTFPVSPITLNQQDLITTGTGTPTFYYLKKNQIIVTPAPDTALPLNLYYSYRIADMVNDSDVPDIPEDYHELIALIAAEDAFIKDGRASELLVKKMSQFETMMDQDSQERTIDMPRMIVETGNVENYGYMF